MKADLYSIPATTNSFIQNCLVMLCIHNYSATAFSFKYLGTIRTIPAAVDGVPVNSFVIDLNGHSFDVDLKFPSTNKDVIIDYALINTH